VPLDPYSGSCILAISPGRSGVTREARNMDAMELDRTDSLLSVVEEIRRADLPVDQKEVFFRLASAYIAAEGNVAEADEAWEAAHLAAEDARTAWLTAAEALR
jgi:hypothetical protein